MTKTQYHNMLKADIRELVSFLVCRTLQDMIGKSWDPKIKLGHLRKRKADQVTGVSWKKPKGSDTRSKVQSGQSRCRKCGRLHEGACRAGSLGCYKYGKTGHVPHPMW